MTAKTITKVLVDATVEADVNVRTWRNRGETPAQYAERHAKVLESECRDFHDHCRDHRSLDHIRLSVIRRYEYVCQCGAEYDSETDAKNCGCESV